MGFFFSRTCLSTFFIKRIQESFVQQPITEKGIGLPQCYDGLLHLNYFATYRPPKSSSHRSQVMIPCLAPTNNLIRSECYHISNSMHSLIKSSSSAFLPQMPTCQNDHGVKTFPLRLSQPFMFCRPPVYKGGVQLVKKFGFGYCSTFRCYLTINV